MQRNSRLLYLLVAAMVGLYATLGLIQYRQHEALQSVALGGNKETVWSVMQIEVEYLRLANAMNHQLRDPVGMTMEDLQLRYELFVGRLQLLDEEKSQHLFTNRALVTELRNTTTQFVQDADRSIGSAAQHKPGTGTLEVLLSRLTALREPIHDLSLDASATYATAVDNRNAQIRQQVVVTGAITALQGLLTFILALAIIRQYRHRRAAQHDADNAKLKLVETAARLEAAAIQRAARDELEEITQALPLVVYRLRRNQDGSDARFTFVSERVQELMGVAQDDVLNGRMPLEQYVHPDDRAAVDTVSSQALTGLQKYSQEYRLLLPGDRVRWIYAESMPRLQDDGSVLSTGYLQAIDNIKIRERKLIEMTEQQRVIFDNIPSGLILSADGLIRQHNEGFAAMMGVPGTNLQGQTADMMFDNQDDHDAFNAFAVPLLDQGLKVDKEREFSRMVGPRFTGRLVGRRLRVAEYQRATIWVMEDVSERKEAEVAMRRAKEIAEEATRLKSDFLANMSHEIRTPMNAIIGLSHLALKTDLNPRQNDYLQKIQQSGKHLLGVINDILDFSRVEAGKLSVENVAFELDEVLGNVTNVIADKTTAKGLELIYDVAPDVPRSLMGDPLRLGQVLINYANNAVKFTEHGEIAIVVRREPTADDQLVLRFEVRDTGIGLTGVQINGLFKSFAQADASTTRKYGGTGLGLVICKGLVELMGGEVGVTSEPGHGSTFWFTASLGLGERRASPALPPQLDLRGRRVLVVDDNDHAAQVLVDMLDMIGFAVKSVNAGARAIEAVQEASQAAKPFDIVLLDWQMPGMDGLETARRIAELSSAATPHFVMVTAYGREEVVKSAAQVGIEHILVKPVSPSVLFDAMMRVAGQQAVPTWTPRELSGDAGFQAIKPLQGARILLAEDNELNQQVAVELLRDAGFVVDVAEDGRQALDAIARASKAAAPYDAVLMDMQMPVMDGIAATVEIRKNRRNAALPVIAMTANAMLSDRDRCARAGMNDFVAKPIEPDDLWRALSKWISPRPGLPVAKLPVEAPDVSPVAQTDAGEDQVPHDIRGLDTALGLQRVMHKRPLYLRLLRLFATSSDGIDREVAEALDADDWATALRLAHTLKGVAGNIGATDLQAHAAELEGALESRASRDAINTLLQTAGRLQADLVQDIQAHLEALSPSAPPVVNTQHLQSVCRQLARLLASDDASAGDLLDRHAVILETAFGSGYSALAQGVRDFEFDAALVALEQCADRLGLALK